MEVAFNLSETDFSEVQNQLFKTNLDIHDDLDKKFGDIAKTAFIEYMDMIIGNGIPDKAAEVRENRLEYMIKYFYKSRIPKESEIQTVFQLSSTASKTLLKNIRSKKRTSISKQINNTVTEVLNHAILNNGKYHIEIKSENILKEINEIIMEKGPGLYTVKQVRGIASIYECPRDTMNLLKKEYGVN